MQWYSTLLFSFQNPDQMVIVFWCCLSIMLKYRICMLAEHIYTLSVLFLHHIYAIILPVFIMYYNYFLMPAKSTCACMCLCMCLLGLILCCHIKSIYKILKWNELHWRKERKLLEERLDKAYFAKSCTYCTFGDHHTLAVICLSNPFKWV